MAARRDEAHAAPAGHHRAAAFHTEGALPRRHIVRADGVFRRQGEHDVQQRAEIPCAVVEMRAHVALAAVASQRADRGRVQLPGAAAVYHHRRADLHFDARAGGGAAQPHEAARQVAVAVERAIRLQLQRRAVLEALQPQRRDDPPARPELAHPCPRHIPDASRRDHAVIGGARGIASRAIARDHHDLAAHRRALQVVPRLRCDHRVHLNAGHAARRPDDLLQDRGVVARARADLQHVHAGGQAHLPDHQRHHARLAG